MTPRRTPSPILRLGVPDLFRQGTFEQVLILTFGADVEFYERILGRHFGNYRNQVVLADGRLLDRAVLGLAAAGTLRHLNRSWIAGPVRSRHAAHAKLILLAGPESGLLLVGSGNLSISGYAGAGECFTPYRWSPEDPAALAAFTTVRSLTDGLFGRGQLDSVTADRLGVFWSAYDWWHEPPTAVGPVRHNLDVPLGAQLADAVGHAPVEELIVIAPFHDPSCAALDRLAARLRPKHLLVFVQPSQCSVDPNRLAAVVAKHKGEIHSIAAAGDHRTAYLHAKIILAKTKSGAVCLTGSANCSMVALWAAQPEANIELGNLAIGARDDFDYLLDPEAVTVAGPVDPTTLDLRVQDDDDGDDDEEGVVRVVDLQLDGSTLTALLDATLEDGAQVTIEVDGQTISATIVLEPIETGWTRLTAELTDADVVAAVESVAVITVRIGDTRAGCAVPYQLDHLRAQDRRRVDADRLRHAARLELEDPDLEQALAALEEILVGDNVARWGRDKKVTMEDAEGPSITWDEIDWEAVRRHPRFGAYGALAGVPVPGSGLAAYLEALSQVVRELLEPDDDSASRPVRPVSPDQPDEDEGEGDVFAGVEGTDVDDLEDDPPSDEPVRQSPAARNRRLIRNFVRRNLAALEQRSFREGAGPGIVVPNLIILNWVCWWVATKDENHVGPELVDERLRLWKLLWGDTSGDPGYLDELDDEHKTLVLERFDDQEFEAVTTASIADVWAGIPAVADPAYRLLRNILRRAVSHPCWQVHARQVADAAVLTNKRPTTIDPLGAAEVADRLWEIGCEPHSDLDARVAIAARAGLAASAVSMTTAGVSVDGTNAPRSVDQADIVGSIDVDQAQDALSVWAGIADLTYYRLKWNSGVAFYNAEQDEGWIVPDAGEEVELADLQPTYPSWRVELDKLCDSVEATATSAA